MVQQHKEKTVKQNVKCENCSIAQPCLDHDYRTCKTGVIKNPGCSQLECLN